MGRIHGRFDQNYRRVVDLRPYSISAVLFDGQHTTGDRKLQLHHVSLLTADELLREITDTFDCDPLELEIMQLDCFVDVLHVPVSWFRQNAYVKGKHAVREYDHGGPIETMVLGSGNDLTRIYAKSAEWRQEFERAVRTAKRYGQQAPPYSEMYGYDDGQTVTRIERQMRGTAVPSEMQTVHSLFDRAADLNPFQRLVLPEKSGRFVDPGRLSLEERGKVLLTERLVQEMGLAGARAHVNKESSGNAARWFKQFNRLVGDATVQTVTAENLLDRFRQGIRSQLKA